MNGIILIMDKLQMRLTPDDARLLLLLLDGTDYDQLTPDDRTRAVVMRKYLAYRVARFWPTTADIQELASDAAKRWAEKINDIAEWNDSR